jgi:hypothetical protein
MHVNFSQEVRFEAALAVRDILEKRVIAALKFPNTLEDFCWRWLLTRDLATLISPANVFSPGIDQVMTSEESLEPRRATDDLAAACGGSWTDEDPPHLHLDMQLWIWMIVRKFLHSSVRHHVRLLLARLKAFSLINKSSYQALRPLFAQIESLQSFDKLGTALMDLLSLPFEMSHFPQLGRFQDADRRRWVSYKLPRDEFHPTLRCPTQACSMKAMFWGALFYREQWFLSIMDLLR